MVESKERKAAFLREVVRTLELAATVENARFEDLARETQWQAASDAVAFVDPATFKDLIARNVPMRLLTQDARSVVVARK